MSKRVEEKLGFILTSVQDVENNPLGMVEKDGFVEYTKKFFRLCLTALTGTEFKEGEDKLTGNKSLPEGAEIVELFSLIRRFLAARDKGMAALVEQARAQVMEGKLTKQAFEATYGSITTNAADAPKEVSPPGSASDEKKKKKRKVKGKEFRKRIVKIMNDASATESDFEEIFYDALAYRKKRKFWAWLIGGSIVLVSVAGVTTAVIILTGKDDDESGDVDVTDDTDGFDLDTPPAQVTIDDSAEPLALCFG